MRDRANKWGREVPGKTPVEPPWVTAETNGTAHGPVCQKPPQGACDQGPGLDEAQIPLLFERFYRSNAGDSQAVYGHGLGLYIVRRLVEAMGGEAGAENRPQGGACFWFRLPRLEERGEHGL